MQLKWTQDGDTWKAEGYGFIYFLSKGVIRFAGGSDRIDRDKWSIQFKRSAEPPFQSYAFDNGDSVNLEDAKKMCQSHHDAIHQAIVNDPVKKMLYEALKIAQVHCRDSFRNGGFSPPIDIAKALVAYEKEI